ncbi:major capsid protein [Brachyspira alvinipulli]|uniref:major capsid protein n=1 Tax=Brachyspira alvinipulli TaxID=84379 RepID=UPI0004894713|nr:major capsid protein [Brachyspira alvinipulli]
MARLSNFYGSVFNGFAKLGKMYDQGEHIPKFISHFYDMFKKSSINRNYNGNVIDLSTKLRVKRMSDYSKTREEIPDPFNLGSETIESYTLPDIKETFILTPEILEKRLAKEPYYYQEEHVAGIVLQEALSDAIEAISRRNEKSAIEALTTGKITTKDDTEILSFPSTATHITTPAHTWGTADADPMKDLVTMCDLLYKDGGVNTFDASGLKTASKELFPSKDVLLIAKYAPLQLGLGKPAVLKPQANANYQYIDLGEYVVTIESRKTDIEMVVWYCGAPLINSMDRIGTIKAVA